MFGYISQAVHYTQNNNNTFFQKVGHVGAVGMNSSVREVIPESFDKVCFPI